MGYAIKINTKYRNDNTGRELLLPAIFTESGLLLSHLRYLAANKAKSASWRERSVFAVRQLLCYIDANESLFTQTTELLRSFALAVTEGTINPSTLEDHSHLYWNPRRLDDASNLLGLITNYTDWLAEQQGHEAQRTNPFRRANSTEQRLNWCAYYHKHNRVFLNHLTDNNDARRKLQFVREVQTPQSPVLKVSSVKRFPETEICMLLDEGFVRPYTNASTPAHMRIDYKNQAITLLMHYGGVRKCEALQLYLSDIVVDRKRTEAVVRIYHPSHGDSPDPTYSNRREYLACEYQLVPRTDYLKSQRLHLGWKAPLLTDRRGCFQVHFFPPEKATEFLLAWRNYLAYQRVEPPDSNRHPYAFTNSLGHPETLKNFQRLHERAVKRIGFEHTKHLGTTEHGHRHAYGYRLAEHGFTQIEIQKAMHHKSPDSCLVYIQPSDDDLRKKMRAVELYE